MTLWRILGLPVLSVALVSGGAPAAALDPGVARIELQAEVAAPRRELSLGDLARVTATTPGRQRALERVPMCFAPAAGTSRHISRDYVLRKLRQERVDTAGLTLSGADLVRITAVSTRIPAETIVTAVTEALTAAMPWAPDEATIEPPRTLEDLVVAGADPTLEVHLPAYDDFLGSTPVRVAVYAGGERRRTVRYRFTIAVDREVYVAADRIPRGTILTPVHVHTERRNIASLGGQYLTEADTVLGQRARRTVRRDTRLTSALLEAPPVVARGDQVRVWVEGDQFQITVVGRARKAGITGDVIPVDLPSRRRVAVRVRGPGEAVLVE